MGFLCGLTWKLENVIDGLEKDAHFQVSSSASNGAPSKARLPEGVADERATAQGTPVAGAVGCSASSDISDDEEDKGRMIRGRRSYSEDVFGDERSCLHRDTVLLRNSEHRDRKS